MGGCSGSQCTSLHLHLLVHKPRVTAALTRIQQAHQFFSQKIKRMNKTIYATCRRHGTAPSARTVILASLALFSVVHPSTGGAFWPPIKRNGGRNVILNLSRSRMRMGIAMHSLLREDILDVVLCDAATKCRRVDVGMSPNSSPL